MPPCCAACPADMYADHSLRLAQEVIAENFFLCLLRQKGKGSGKFRMVQNGSLAAGGKKIFFKLLRPGKLDKLLIHQIVKGNFPFPPPAQIQDFIYGCVTNDDLTKRRLCAYSVFNTFPVYPLSAKPLILLAFCRYRYHTSLFQKPGYIRHFPDHLL